jgi:hypothetical protein
MASSRYREERAQSGQSRQDRVDHHQREIDRGDEAARATLHRLAAPGAFGKNTQDSATTASSTFSRGEREPSREGRHSQPTTRRSQGESSQGSAASYSSRGNTRGEAGAREDQQSRRERPHTSTSTSRTPLRATAVAFVPAPKHSQVEEIDTESEDDGRHAKRATSDGTRSALAAPIAKRRQAQLYEDSDDDFVASGSDADGTSPADITKVARASGREGKGVIDRLGVYHGSKAATTQPTDHAAHPKTSGRGMAAISEGEGEGDESGCDQQYVTYVLFVCFAIY